MTEKSLTGRTVVEASVAPNGALDVFVSRNGQCIHTFSAGREQDIPNGAKLEVEDGMVNVIDENQRVVRSIPIV